jgi:hypothetical protein
VTAETKSAGATRRWNEQLGGRVQSGVWRLDVAPDATAFKHRSLGGVLLDVTTRTGAPAANSIAPAGTIVD